MNPKLATDAEIESLVSNLQTSPEDDIVAIDALLVTNPDDARLHFMKGSVLAGRAEHIAAHQSLSRAVELAPDFAVARYQLGFFELTSGEADRALSTWGPLLKESKENYLRIFVEGMVHLIRDEFSDAISKFESGIANNTENEPMNGDILLLIKELRNKMPEDGETAVFGEDSGETSASALLLGQFGNRTIN